MKKIILSLILGLFITTNAYAEGGVNMHLTIKTDNSNIYDGDLNVSPCNSDNNGTMLITAYCAIGQSGITSVWDWTWAPGAFITSINEIEGYTSKDKDGNDVYHYWSWSLNGVDGTTALNQYELQEGDLITLNFIDPKDETIQATTRSGSSGSNKKKDFDIEKALEFLYSHQKENGSFGENIYTDWISFSLASAENQKVKPIIYLTKYLTENKRESSLITDYERFAMSLMAIGINPYNINGENYIKKITDSFDGEQFGEKDRDTDDIFALIVLQNTGYDKEDEIIVTAKEYILSKQKENGSWENSVDITGASMQALSFLKDEEKIKESLEKAKEFLKEKQENDGSWGNISSTAWAMGGINALGEEAKKWDKNRKDPLDYLAINQAEDGGTKNEIIENKIWETAYVITALSGKTWNEIMQKFNKPEVNIEKEKRLELEKQIEKILALLEKKNTIKQNTTTVNNINQKEEVRNIDLNKENTANVINAISDAESNWLKTIIKRIFSIF